MDTQIDDLRDPLPSLGGDAPTEQLTQDNAVPLSTISVFRWIGAVLVVIVTGVVAAQWFSTSQVSSEHIDLSGDKPRQTDSQDQYQQELTDSTTDYVIHDAGDLITTDIEARLSEMDSRLVRLDSFVEQMAAHLDQQSNLLIDLQTGLAEQDEVVATIEASHQELRKTLQQQMQARVQTQAKPPAKKTPTVIFDLRISSVRHLGRSTGVIVRSDDHVQFVAIGQEVNGWRLVNADAERLYAEFLHLSGQRHEVQL